MNLKLKRFICVPSGVDSINILTQFICSLCVVKKSLIKQKINNVRNTPWEIKTLKLLSKPIYLYACSKRINVYEQTIYTFDVYAM